VSGPVTDPPPGGPGREDFDDSDLYLATVGIEVVDALAAVIDPIVAAAPPLSDVQRAHLRRLFAGSAR
jgi:hypothetical protein